MAFYLTCCIHLELKVAVTVLKPVFLMCVLHLEKSSNTLC